MAWTEEGRFFPNSLSKFTKSLGAKKEHFWAAGWEGIMGSTLKTEPTGLCHPMGWASGTAGQLLGATATSQGRNVLSFTDYVAFRGWNHSFVTPNPPQAVSRMKALAKNAIRMFAGRQRSSEGAYGAGKSSTSSHTCLKLTDNWTTKGFFWTERDSWAIRTAYSSIDMQFTSCIIKLLKTGEKNQSISGFFILSSLKWLQLI